MTVTKRGRVCGPRQPGLYARISDDRMGDQLGVRRQEEECRERAGREGWPDPTLFIDNSISAYSGARRPRFRALIEAIAVGQIDGLVVWHIDRLYRRPVELEELIDLLDARPGFPIITVTAGDIDLSTASGRMSARILTSVARHESEHRAERLRSKHRELAREGRLGSGGGWRPFGFEDDRVTHKPDEAQAIREAAEYVLAGGNVNGVISDWSRRGIRSPSGGLWRHTSVKNVLVSARVAGIREHKGDETQAIWQPIINPETRARLQSIFEARRVGPRPNTTVRRYLLTGFAFCGLCGAKLASRARSDSRRSYFCLTDITTTDGCGKIRVVAEPLEELVVEMVMQRTERPVSTLLALSKTSDHDTQAIRAALAADEEKLVELAVMWSENEIGRKEWLAARQPTEDRLAWNRRRLGQLVAEQPGLTEHLTDLRQRWKELDLAQRRSVLRLVINKVEIAPTARGPRFNPERVNVLWS